MVFKEIFFPLLTRIFDITSSLSGKSSIIVNFRQLIDNLNLVLKISQKKNDN